MKKQLLMLAFTMAAMTASAQTVLWDGEEATIGSKGGCWDDGNPTVVANPAKDAVNGSDKCLMFTMTNDSRVVKIPFRDWIKPDMQGARRVSLMMRKQTAGTSQMELSDPTAWKSAHVYYQPEKGRCGDPVPFYDQKTSEFKVLYLQEWDINGPCYHPLWGAFTKDCANYTSVGEVLPTGSDASADDAALGTGSCVYDETTDKYYLYYTGHNDVNTKEVLMRATSSDFRSWTKDAEWRLEGDANGYSASVFRDPHVFKGDDNLYHMVVSTRPAGGGDPCFAEFKSSDLKNWEHVGHFNMIWDRFLECPDIFKMGDYWYLVYSESFKAPWSRKVKYMKADTWENLKACFNGPTWPDNKEGVLDSRAFYAGKTASNGTDRYIWGWCPVRWGNDIHEKNINVGADDEPAWGGSLVCHKLIQHADGTLTLGAVSAIDERYSENILQMSTFTVTHNDHAAFSALGSYNHLSMTVATSADSDKFGISLVRNPSAKYYSLVFNPEQNNTMRGISFEQEGEGGIGFINSVGSYHFKRPADNVYHIDIYTDHSVVVMYVNDELAYTQRIYGIEDNGWSINNYSDTGTLTVTGLSVSVIPALQTVDGPTAYWEKTTAKYDNADKWQKLVFDFSANEGLNDYPGVMAITAQTNEPVASQNVFIDNIVIENPDEGGVTGITEIKKMRDGENEKFFDLQGRRVPRPTKGLYIVNGRKVCWQ